MYVLRTMKTTKNTTNDFNRTKIKSINRGEWFGNYKGVEWSVRTEKDTINGNKNWYYISEDGKENDSPTQSIEDAFEALQGNIDYSLSNN